MCKIEMMIDKERKKRMKIDEKVNILVAELEREKNREKAEEEARNLREEVDSLRRKVEEVRKEVSVGPKNRVEGGRSENLTEQVKLNNIRNKSKEGTF